MIKRNWVKTWLLCIITGGLYNWYILWCMYKDLNTMEQKTNKKSMGWIPFLLLSLCSGSLFVFIETCIFHKRAVELAKSFNVKLPIKSPVLFALISIYVPVIGYMIPIKSHNMLIDGYEAMFKE